jgi:hypothetical protein
MSQTYGKNTRITANEIKIDLTNSANSIAFQTASECADKVASFAPTRTGNYKNDIGVAKTKPPRAIGETSLFDAYAVCNVGSTWPIGHLLENGTKNAMAYPHYRPAFMIYRDIYLERMKNVEIDVTSK